jgi:aspartyl-tRNA(Asn)/glutamyl-tRNA(Gln) amidotransferase subunit B
MAERFVKDYALPEYDATLLTQSKAAATYFEATAKACGQPKLASNWIMGEVSRRLNASELSIEQSPVSAAQLAALIDRISDNTISNNAARQVFDHLWQPKLAELVIGDTLEEVTAGVTELNALKQIDAIIEAKGLKQMNDNVNWKDHRRRAAANPKNVESSGERQGPERFGKADHESQQGQGQSAQLMIC